MVRKIRRRCLQKQLLLILAALLGVVILFNRIDYYDLLKFTYDRVSLPSTEPLERVPIQEVLTVRDFIRAAPSQDYDFYQFNHYLSDKIGAYRSLPDTRNPTCSARPYIIPQLHTRVSIVIAFHNEARSTLIRTLMSVYRRTRSKYLHELILIDDFSEDVGLLPALRSFDFPPFAQTNATRRAGVLQLRRVSVKMQRNSRRLGLIESRNRGARLATADYLLFLDSHCEVNAGWLEPLLERCAGADTRPFGGDTRVAVSPVLDSIDAETLTYRASSQDLRGGFDWNLHFHWVQRPPTPTQQEGGQRSPTAFRSPTFAGGIFMISRNWFFKLNAFNTLLQIWGGESIEFSIKLWLCGGRIEIVPCSRVGHIFRRQHPFVFPDDDLGGQATYLRNSKVIAESWLDAYKRHFYNSKPEAKSMDIANSNANDNTNANVTPPYDLDDFKRALQCRPFAWYLQHVYPELRLPNDEFIAFGTLSNGDRCLQIVRTYRHASLNTSSVRLAMSTCYRDDITRWYLQRQNMRLQSNTGACLDVLTPAGADPTRNHQGRVVLQYCRSTTAAQSWGRRGMQLMHAHTRLCLDNPLGDVVVASVCRQPATAASQLFRFSMEIENLQGRQ